MTERTRRENIVRFLQQSVAVAAVIWVMILLLRRAELAAMPVARSDGSGVGPTDQRRALRHDPDGGGLGFSHGAALGAAGIWRLSA